jgi:hypothetical protein
MNLKPGPKLPALITVIAGLILTALPLYADWFTFEPVSAEEPHVQIEETEEAISMSSRVVYTKWHVPSWVPLIGGFLCLAGGRSLGRRPPPTGSGGL